MILQTDPRFPKELGIQRWGCAFRSCQAMAELAMKKELTWQQIIQIYHSLLDTNILEKVGEQNGITEFTVKSFEDVVSYTCSILGDGWECFHIGNMTQFLSYRKPHRTDYTIIYGHAYGFAGNKVEQIGGHYVLGDPRGKILFNPDPSLGFKPTGFLRFRLDKKART